MLVALGVHTNGTCAKKKHHQDMVLGEDKYHLDPLDGTICRSKVALTPAHPFAIKSARKKLAYKTALTAAVIGGGFLPLTDLKRVEIADQFHSEVCAVSKWWKIPLRKSCKLNL